MAALAAPPAPAALPPPVEALPDLAPDIGGIWLDYRWVDFDGGRYRYGPAYLSFELRTQNVGAVPLDVRPDNPLDLPGSTVSQCMSWTADLVCARRRPLTGVHWVDDTALYRFDQYASYELRSLLADGTPDYSTEGLLSSKVRGTGCFVDDMQVRDDGQPVPRYVEYGICTPVESGISPGWADLIPSMTPEQEVPFDDIGDGRYALVLRLNPGGHLHEATAGNNQMVVVIDVVGKNQPFPEVTIVSKTPS